MKEQINDEEMLLAIQHITEKNPEGVKNIETMFNMYIMKMSLLTSEFNKEVVDKDEVAKQVREFLTTVKGRLIGNWCMVKTYLEIIKGLEDMVTKLGGDPFEIKVG